MIGRTPVKVVGLVLGAVLASMSLAAAASAAPPELGRCVAVEKTLSEGGKRASYHGGYSSNNCTKVNKNHRGKYEWLAGPGAHPHFYAVANEPEPVLETTGGSKIQCATIGAEGEYTGPKSEKISKLFFSGCTANGKGCQSNPAKEGEFEVTEVEGELGAVKGPLGIVAGWDLKKSGTWATFTCGTTENPTVEQLKGSVIGIVEKGRGFGDLNRMSYESFIAFTQSQGKQQPESLENQPTDVLSITSIKVPAGQVTEQTGLLATLESTSGFGKPVEEASNQEKLEIRTKPEAGA